MHTRWLAAVWSGVCASTMETPGHNINESSDSENIPGPLTGPSSKLESKQNVYCNNNKQTLAEIKWMRKKKKNGCLYWIIQQQWVESRSCGKNIHIIKWEPKKEQKQNKNRSPQKWNPITGGPLERTNQNDITLSHAELIHKRTRAPNHHRLQW